MIDPHTNPPFWSADGFARSFATLRRGFVAYARWLDSISWKRFFVLSLLALVCAGVLSELPPFNIRWGTDSVIESSETSESSEPPEPPATTSQNSTTAKRRDAVRAHGPIVLGDRHFEVRIDDSGVHIVPVKDASAASEAASGAAPSASAASTALADDGDANEADDDVARLPVLSRADREEIRHAVGEAKEAIRDASRQAAHAPRMTHSFRVGDSLPPFTTLLIFISMTIKIMAKGRFQAEAKAVVATEMAESEALKRQVVEARMAAMQAQVEPHFLFNTLASIDHLIETDPPRASAMQKNLIALLRASMPSMREANAPGTRGVRDLGRELAVIRPYLEILKVRMEERLRTEIRVSDGLLSAEFPPMMLQSLVENAIKHGLEPKPDGGLLTLLAEIVHGQLAVTVTDTGLGFGRAATAGTGIGLSNIRERLALLYGTKASLTVSEPPGGGTSVTIAVPYMARAGAA